MINWPTKEEIKYSQYSWGGYHTTHIKYVFRTSFGLNFYIFYLLL